jgi:hypothetical protein
VQDSWLASGIQIVRKCLKGRVYKFGHNSFGNECDGQVCYHHDIAALSAKVIGSKSRPELEFTANMGMDGAFMGGAIRYDTKSAKMGMSKVGEIF